MGEGTVYILVFAVAVCILVFAFALCILVFALITPTSGMNLN